MRTAVLLISRLGAPVMLFALLTACGGGSNVAPMVQVSAASVSFGNVPVGVSIQTINGATKPSDTITLSNTGTGTLSISGATLTGTDAAEFSVVNNCVTPMLAGSGSCAIIISFAPQMAGTFSATLSIASNAKNSPTLVSLSGSATAPSWTWVSGTNTTNSIGVYGTQGVPAASNMPGGRAASVSWIDASSNLWLFGGFGLDSLGHNGSFNDLWKFNPTSGQWTWVSGANTANAAGVYGTQGVAAASNVPGCRDSAVSWTDSSGKFWLFGGVCESNPRGNFPQNDLWKYDPTAGQWTWVGGANTVSASGVYGTQGVPAAGNVPGARSSAVSWVDASGNLWLFGGIGVDSAGSSGNLNDLWKYDPGTAQWTWVSGANTVNASAVYGTQGTAAAGNVPAAGFGGSSWSVAGSFWLFQGPGSVLWKFDLASNQWTWVSGTQTGTDVFGTTNDMPAYHHQRGATWTDSSGNLWLFGGSSNELWKYTPSSGQWTWAGGSNTGNAPVYGTQGVASTTNDPGMRSPAAWWTDSSGNFWLFGGTGQTVAVLNDLWKTSPP
jgi:N-acetylneuraminic acid mutarotase